MSDLQICIFYLFVGGKHEKGMVQWSVFGWIAFSLPDGSGHLCFRHGGHIGPGGRFGDARPAEGESARASPRLITRKSTSRLADMMLQRMDNVGIVVDEPGNQSHLKK